MTLRRWQAALAAAVLFAACGPDGPTAATTSVAPAAPAAEADAASETTTTEADETAVSVPANGEVVDVRALDNSFIVEDIEIAAGIEVRWENRGRNDHNVIPVDESQDWGVDLEDFTPGDSYAHVFTTPGIYRYYCTIHGTADIGMVGSVTVN